MWTVEEDEEEALLGEGREGERESERGRSGVGSEGSCARASSAAQFDIAYVTTSSIHVSTAEVIWN